MRRFVAEGAGGAGRDPAEIPFAQYIRVCVDEDEAAARRAFALNMLGYALARPGQPKDKGYRAHFGRMGFEEILTELEAKRDGGTPVAELVDAVPNGLLRRVGYFRKAVGPAEAVRPLPRGVRAGGVRLVSRPLGALDARPRGVSACQ